MCEDGFFEKPFNPRKDRKPVVIRSAEQINFWKKHLCDPITFLGDFVSERLEARLHSLISCSIGQ